MSKYTRSTQRTITKYGEVACLHAFKLNRVDGEGPMMIGGYGRGSVSRGNALINAGEEINRVFIANATEAR